MRLTNLHASTKTKDEMKGRLFLDVVIGESTAIFELLSSEDKTLLVGRDPFLVLDLRLYIVDGIARLHLKGDGLASDWERCQ